jgi:hypothetical protein
MLPSCNISQPLLLDELRNLCGTTSAEGFRRWVEGLSPKTRKACVEAAKTLLTRETAIFEDGQVVVAIAVIADQIPDELVQQARATLEESRHWNWVVKTNPEA